MENQFIVIQIYDINNIEVITSFDAVSAHGNYALNRIGQGGFRVPANSSIVPHLEAANQAWIQTIGITEPLLRWHIQTIIISDIAQVDEGNGSFIDVSGPGIDALLDFRRTGVDTIFDSDVAPVLPAIISYAPPFAYEVVGAPTEPSREVYIISSNHSVLNLLRQAQQQTGDSFFINPIYRKVFWYSTESPSSGLVFSETGTDMPIITIKRIVKGDSPITRLKAFGAGTGEDALTLTSTPLTAPDIAALEAEFPGITWEATQLRKTSLEVTGYPIRDGEIKFPYIKPEDETPEALYRAVYILNQTAGSYFAAQEISRVSYEITSIIESYLVPVGETARLTYNNILDPEYDQYTVDEDLRIQSVSHRIDANGIRYSTIVLSNSTDEWLDENQKLVKKILELDETSKSTSSPPSGSPSVIPVYHHSLLELGHNDHPQYLRADGGTPLVGNLIVGGLYTVDGVNISAFKATYDAHAANSSAHHAPITIGAGGLSAKLGLIGQQLTLGSITHLETTGRTPNDHHNQQHVITGSDHTVTGSKWNLVGLTNTNTLGVLSLNAIGNSLIPELTDTYDLGTATKLWRKGWLSELESIRFVENTVTVMGGWFMIPHGSGTLQEDVDAVETQIDFGTALSTNDFIVMRANLQLEYLKVVSFASGTTYNVTRNVDGTGANSWAQGTPFVILGNLGDGRIEFDAQSAGPRISVFEQGTAYNSQTERVRIGDMASWGGYSGYGIGIGDALGDRLAYTPSDGFGIVAGGGNLSIDSNGITMVAANSAPSGISSQSIDWLYSSTLVGQIVPWANGTTKAMYIKTIGGNNSHSSTFIQTTGGDAYDVGIELRASRTGGSFSFITVQNSPTLDKINLYADRTYTKNHLNVAGGLIVGNDTATPVNDQIRLYNGATLMGQISTSDTTWLRVNQDVVKNIYTPRAIVAAIGFSTTSDFLPTGGDMVYNGDLRTIRSSVSYTTSPPIPIPSANPYPFYNLTWTSANNGTKTLTGVPTGVSYIIARLQCQPQSAGGSLAIGPSSGVQDAVIHYGGVASINQSQVVFIRTASNTVFATIVGTVAGIHLIVLAYGF